MERGQGEEEGEMSGQASESTERRPRVLLGLTGSVASIKVRTLAPSIHMERPKYLS